MRRDERPIRRKTKGGRDRWVARFTTLAGPRKSNGTYAARGPCRAPADDGRCCAQHAIWAGYEEDAAAAKAPPKPIATARAYSEGDWLVKHPRASRTAAGYKSRAKAVMDVEVELEPGVTVLFGDVPLDQSRPRHVNELVDVMLREHGRAASGTRAVVSVLSAMYRDAIVDDLMEMNPAAPITVRDSDPRVQRAARRPVVASWEEMHRFAAAAGEHETLVRTIGDLGLRLGEGLALEARHDQRDVMVVEQSAWRGEVTPGTKQGARREVPIPPGLRAILDAYATPLRGPLFPGPSGSWWTDRSFYRLVWYPAQDASGLGLRPHDLRHSFTSHLRAAGVDPADLAKATGHSVQTATSRYTHSTGATFDAMRRAVG